MYSISSKEWATKCQEIHKNIISYIEVTCHQDRDGTTIGAKSKRGFGAESVLLIRPAQGAASRWRGSQLALFQVLIDIYDIVIYYN